MFKIQVGLATTRPLRSQSKSQTPPPCGPLHVKLQNDVHGLLQRDSFRRERLVRSVPPGSESDNGPLLHHEAHLPRSGCPSRSRNPERSLHSAKGGTRSPQHMPVRGVVHEQRRVLHCHALLQGRRYAEDDPVSSNKRKTVHVRDHSGLCAPDVPGPCSHSQEKCHSPGYQAEQHLRDPCERAQDRRFWNFQVTPAGR